MPLLKEIAKGCVLAFTSLVTLESSATLLPSWSQELPAANFVQGGKFSKKDWDSYGRKANRYERFGQLQKSEQSYRFALKESEKAGSDPDYRASSLLDLARLLSKLGKGNEAIACYEQCLAIRRKQWHEKSQRLDPILEGLAQEYLNAHRVADAESLLQDLIDLRTKVLLPNDPKIIKTLWLLEDVYTREGKITAAIDIHKRYMAARVRAGQPSQEVISDLNILAALYARHENWDLSEVSRKRELTLQLAGGDSGSPALLDTYYRLAECQQRLGRFDEAASNLKLGLALKEKSCGQKSTELLQFLAPLCNCFLEARKYPEAEVVCKRKLKIQEVAFGKDHAKTRRTIGKLVTLYSEWGKPDIARSYSVRLEESADKAARK